MIKCDKCNLKPKKESVKVILTCKNTLFSTILFHNVICSGELQIDDLRLSLSYFKSFQKH